MGSPYVLHICWQSQVPRHQVLAASKIASDPGRADADVFVAVLYELVAHVTHVFYICTLIGFLCLAGY